MDLRKSGLSFSDIGKIMGITKQTAAEIEKSALAK
jgi:transcriptional regulator